jgi:mono/diheme cytochrome c family protein
MKQFQIPTKLIGMVVIALAGLGSCFAEPNGVKPATGGKPAMSQGGAPASGEGGAAGAEGPRCVARPAVEGAECKPAISGEPLRARLVDDVPQDTLYFTETLFGEFASLCGSCHVASDLGGFGVSSTTFATKVDGKVLSAIASETASCERDDSGKKKDERCFQFMPPAGTPNGRPWSERKENLNDPVTRLYALLKLWDTAGRPIDVFTIPADAGLGGTTPYAIDAELAETFTNIGTCIPDAGMVATELDRSCALDAQFADLEKKPDSQLPEEQLGLPTTLDQTDLFTFDSAELARHGVVAYSPQYPLWSDDAGKLRHVRVPQGQSIKFDAKTKQFEIPKNTRFYKTFMKKILDRDGVERFRKIETRLIVSRPGEDSLFGTYIWNDGETQATLHTDPLNNTKPFKDKVLLVVTDVPKADEVKAKWEAGEVRNYTKELDYEGVVRRYAVPSSERCIQCHMGGVNGSFVLGFSPLDLYNRKCDPETLESEGHCDGGIIEPTLGDQLTQLERFISYGIVSNYDIASQLVSLEDAQGTSKAPRKYRNQQELVAQGYLLGNCAHCHNPNGYPSVQNPELVPLLDFLPSKTGGIFEFPLDRYSPRILRNQGEVQLPYITPSLRDIVAPQRVGWTAKETSVPKPGSTLLEPKLLEAPWRSLIYRNVDTPFTYVDDATIYPHMPLNTPGFDCRAPRVLGEWMVSLPAVRKHPQLAEDWLKSSSSNLEIDNDPQPYVEVREGEPNYLQAKAQGDKRAQTFRDGLRGNDFCPETKDIVDVWGVLYAKPGDIAPVPRDGTVKGMPVDGVPDRPHWVITDVTDPPGDWNPRRTDWENILVKQNFTESEEKLAQLVGVEQQVEQARLAREKITVALLQNIDLSGELEAYVESRIPMGLWEPHDGCDFSKVPKVADYTASERPRWFTVSQAPADAPVYETLPGAAIFNMVCVNCHGPNADSSGRQAVTLQELTGGQGRVANFRDGFFGPLGSGGGNRDRVFHSDRTAMRYLAWMALGGTRTKIPTDILGLVAATQVLGRSRPEPPPVTNANMLETGRALCRALITRGHGEAFEPATGATERFQRRSGLILSNGDAELWGKLCTFNNPSPIHALVATASAEGFKLFNYNDRIYRSAAFPVDAPVGNVRGEVEPKLTVGNEFPWCVIPPTDPAEIAFVDGLRSANDQKVPLCPAPLLALDNLFPPDSPELEEFATHGAINAGLAVYAYLDKMLSQGEGREPTFKECERLTPKAEP